MPVAPRTLGERGLIRRRHRRGLFRRTPPTWQEGVPGALIIMIAPTGILILPIEAADKDPAAIIFEFGFRGRVLATRRD